MQSIKNLFPARFIVFCLFFCWAAVQGYAQESVQLQTDRDRYIAGENVWFTVSCNSLTQDSVVTLSNVVYVELLDKSNTPVHQLKVNLQDGVGSTRFLLDIKMATGNYTLRAYTQWMRNYQADFFVHKVIMVINPFAEQAMPESDSRFLTDTLFVFPEGGVVLQGKVSTLLLQAVGKDGVAMKGEFDLVSPHDSVVAQVNTGKNGFAKLQYVPKENGVYTLRSRTNGSLRYALPKASVTATKLVALEKGGEYYFALQGDLSGSKYADECVFYVVQDQGQEVLKKTLRLKEGNLFRVSKSAFTDGVFQAVVTDKNTGRVIGARYFVVQTKASNPVLIHTDATSYTTRASVKVRLDSTQELRNVSVSVAKKGLVANDDVLAHRDFRSLHYTELFSVVRNNLSLTDVLMAFTPPQKIRYTSPAGLFLPEYRGEIISGKITYATTNKPADNIDFTLGFVDSIPSLDIVNTSSDGQFFFEANRTGEKEIVIQPFLENRSSEHFNIDLTPSFSKRYARSPMPKCFVSKTAAEGINRAIINMQIGVLYSPYVVVKDSVVFQDNLFGFYGEQIRHTSLGSFISLATLEEVLDEIIPFTYVRRKKGVARLEVFRESGNKTAISKTYTMVDGVLVRNINEMLKISPRKIQAIHTVNESVYFKDYDLGSILNIQTSTGDMSAYTFPDYIFRQSYKGYTQPYLFRAPNYASEYLGNKRTPDYRNTLHWESNVVADSKGGKDIQFYTGDDSGEYIILVQGVNRAGYTEKYTHTFTVNEPVVTGK